ncbi:MAG: sigma-70 family RNA polymerase sigma factor [Gemmatimonadetes bacterium]|nr:sigma-70 family RNA polymerase sigma factor [Gemmatimonadota bacterium]MYB98217.1 sigma-70 family RNA polymerase sigma factor [Gemmatimonadota bacterium]MYI44962.1 sigma-70 family RNA polymerase sigma factor [Gemmatimonadota bacterium]
MPHPRLPGPQAEVRVSDSAVPGSLGFSKALPDGSGSKPTDAAADDVPIETQAYRRGDPAGFASLLKRFGPLIRSVVNAYSEDKDDQDDLYQEVSIRLLTRGKYYRDVGALRGWVITLARGVCRNWRASQAALSSAIDRYSAAFPPAEESDALLDDPSRLLQYQMFLERLERALAELPSRQASAWRLVHIEGHTPNRAARIMKTTPATVRSHIRHARTRLRELMQDVRDELS